MRELFTDLPEALENNRNIAYRCSYRPLTNKPMLPNFNTESSNVNDELKLQAKIGLEKLKDFILINIEDQNEKNYSQTNMRKDLITKLR